MPSTSSSRNRNTRRYGALRQKMREHKLDATVVPGGPSHWSFGGGMLWLTGHWEWHALAAYVLVPLDAEPTLIYSMGGTHAEAVRRAVSVAIKDVRHSRNGRYADVRVGSATAFPIHLSFIPRSNMTSP
jgi:hypothetical protein